MKNNEIVLDAGTESGASEESHLAKIAEESIEHQSAAVSAPTAPDENSGPRNKKDAEVVVAKKAAKKGAQKATKIEKKPWVVAGPKVYGKLVQELSHLSAKLVHTKAGAVGVRLGPDALIDAPYVAVCCMPAGSVPLDYVSDSKIANQHRQMMLASEGRESERFEHIDAQDCDAAKNAWALAQSTDQVYGQNRVSMRLRQVLLPLGRKEELECEYVSLTPLHSGGLSELLRSRIRAEEAAWRAAFESAHQKIDGVALDDKKSKKAFAQSRETALIADPVFIPFGGSKPFNASAFGVAVQQGLFFAAPSSNQAVRLAVRLHHRGIESLRPAWETLKSYANLHREMRRIRAQGGTIGLKEREKEREILSEMLVEVLRKGDAARGNIRNAMDRGVVAELTSQNCDPIQRGLIDPERRNRLWAMQLGAALAKHIDDFLAKNGKGGIAINLDESDRKALAIFFSEEALR